MGIEKSVFRKTSAIGVATAIALLASACSLLGPQVNTETYVTDDGAIVVQSVKLTATVTSIDSRKRTVTIDPKYGDKRTVKVPDEMVNFNQIRVGDEVEADIVEETAVSLIRGGAAESAGALDAVALAPVGAKPALTAVSSRELTADVIAIDAHSHSVTLEFIDGSTESFKVGKHIDLSEVSLNDSVRVQVTDAIAIDFHKKQK
jgi:hypothetical protein